MSKILAILVTAVFIFGFTACGTLTRSQNQDLQKSARNKEETMRKLAQDLSLLNMTLVLIREQETTKNLVQTLENFQSDDAVFLEKIQKDWLPLLKIHIGALEETEKLLEEFSRRTDIVSPQEIIAEVEKRYPDDLSVRMQQLRKELQAAGILEK